MFLALESSQAASSGHVANATASSQNVNQELQGSQKNEEITICLFLAASIRDLVVIGCNNSNVGNAGLGVTVITHVYLKRNITYYVFDYNNTHRNRQKSRRIHILIGQL